MMSRGAYLGEFEEIVLLAVARCGEEAYGMEVRREIAGRTGRDVSIGAVYATIERLGAKGLVRIVEPQRDPARDGRARRFFVLAPAGVEALDAAEHTRQRLRAGLKLGRTRST